MTPKDIAIKVEAISKRYRIGLKEEIHDSLFSAMADFVKGPIKNYRKYRSLYKFDDPTTASKPEQIDTEDDIIWALRDVSFEVETGEVLGIIGRNGAGKSTLLKILCRITEPTSGIATIHGRISSLLEVGTGFHQELTGRENVYLNGTILGMKKKEVDRKFDEIVEFSGIEKFIDTPVKRYSSGMRVRLAFSVAAHLEPEILMIDEVLAVGDADFQRKCLNKMEDAGKRGHTVLFVSHNMPAVARLCQRTIHLENGSIFRDGLTHEVLSAYMTSGLGTTAAREWAEASNAPGGKVARLRAVRVRDAGGQVAESLDIRHAFHIEMDYEVIESGYVLLPHFRLVTEQGIDAFVTVDLDPDWRGRSRPAGRYVSTVEVPGNLLAEGVTFVNCYLITLNPDTVQFAETSAVSFLIFDSLDGNSARGDYVKHMPGVMRPMLNWNTRFSPNGRKPSHRSPKP